MKRAYEKEKEKAQRKKDRKDQKKKHKKELREMMELFGTETDNHDRSVFISMQEWDALTNCLITNHLKGFHMYELQNMSPSSVRNLWDKYDPKHLSEIGRNGCMVFAHHCCERLIEDAKDALLFSKPNIKKSGLDEHIAENINKILPGKPLSQRAGCCNMWKILGNIFDPFKKGFIRREEFLKKWDEFADKVFVDHNTATNPLRCVIL